MIAMETRAIAQSPLRYPGGKSRQARAIAQRIGRCRELRSPFSGGASVELAHRALGLSDGLWLNDADPWIALFWQAIKLPEGHACFASRCRGLRHEFGRGDRQEFGALLRAALHWELGELGCAPGELPPLPERFMSYYAASVFALNRASFNGCLRAGGFSNFAGSGDRNDRFTRNAIAYAVRLGRWLGRSRDRYRATCFDFEAVLAQPGHDVAIYLDPPYAAQSKSNLYLGHRETADGSLLDRLAVALDSCPHRWLMSVEDSPENRDRFGRWHIETASWCYSSTGDRRQGQELIICNF